MGSVCPVTALGSYLSLRFSAPRPLFMFSDGCPLTQQQLSSSVQSILHGAGYSGSYSGHSYRIGAATTAAARRVPDHLAMHTRSISGLQLVPLSVSPPSWWLNR